MLMNATDEFGRFSATFRATVDLPEPEPPAIPMMSGFTSGSSAFTHVASMRARAEWAQLECFMPNYESNHIRHQRVCNEETFSDSRTCPRRHHAIRLRHAVSGHAGHRAG